MTVTQIPPSRRIDQRLKLRELQVLAAVVDCGSMIKAATQLGMSQPAVSAAIANLEAGLGVQLLDRSPRGVEPTIYSRALLSRGAWCSTSCVRASRTSNLCWIRRQEKYASAVRKR